VQSQSACWQSQLLLLVNEKHTSFPSRKGEGKRGAGSLVGFVSQKCAKSSFAQFDSRLTADQSCAGDPRQSCRVQTWKFRFATNPCTRPVPRCHG